MGAGKGYVMRWLSTSNIFALEHLVKIDPDFFKRKMPEWAGYVAADRESAGGHCHKESGLMQEIAQEEALQRSRNTWVDGSLGNHQWFTSVFKDIRERFPQYKIAVFYIFCRAEQVMERAAKRALVTGREVPKEKLLESISATAESVKVLGPQADFLAVINNEERLPVLERVEDRTHSFAAIHTKFGFDNQMSFPARLPALRLLTAKIDIDLGEQGRDWIKYPQQTNLEIPIPSYVSTSLSTELCDIQSYNLVFSPLAEVNLDLVSRKESGIPPTATHFSYCYGAIKKRENGTKSRFPPDVLKYPDKEEEHAMVLLMETGGYVYVDASSSVLQASMNASVERQAEATNLHTIQFGQPMSISKSVLETLDQNNRWSPTKLGHITRVGCSSFCWVLPGEAAFAPFGGFVYSFGPGRAKLLFPVNTH
eukprot:TRINITY_DN7620_c0_g2_i1.p1 TRINITY_DN7620_c0_g2~~TRINITY_DN7620_c0_g2_i1.p1  ORF type:complete len:424 (+),score=123.63 TRINITY_DN7620_c0_g2_i1:479-1750(+)